MKIAIIGSGISGLSTAFYLSKFSDITLFEKNNKFGGHANTYDFNFQNKNLPIDCGFIVYNKKNYPNFVKNLIILILPAIYQICHLQCLWIKILNIQDL